jgi:hypothetical protein
MDAGNTAGSELFGHANDQERTKYERSDAIVQADSG